VAVGRYRSARGKLQAAHSMLPRGASAVRTSTMVHVGTHKQSHRLSHVVPHQIFDDMEEREGGKRKRWLFRKATTS
jgi:hypothetical protein